MLGGGVRGRFGIAGGAGFGPGLARLNRRRAFRLITVLLLIGVGLTGAEGLLRWRQAVVAGSDRLNPGMIQYDPRLGWRLSPGWQGDHRHHDFTARYRINDEGFRYDPALSTPRRGRVIAVVGDSFTFGLGVNDAEPFVSRLNRNGRHTYLNLALPGSSTDQQALLLEEVLPRYRPDEVWLVVYVGNDLLDNQRARPLQLNAAKPHFELHAGELRLNNTPVPPPSLPTPAPPAPALETLLLGEAGAPAGWGDRLARRFALVRAFREIRGDARDHRPVLEARFREATALFDAILTRIQQTCIGAGAELRLLLLAGRSYVEAPASLSAQFQEVQLRHVAAACQNRRIPCLNVAEQLRARFRKQRERLFYPNDGHLTPRGHAAVAELLEESGWTAAANPSATP